MHKAFHYKSTVQDEAQGIAEHVVSVFANKDSDEDIVLKGAFSRTIRECKDRGRVLPPGVWSHIWERPVAATLEAKEEDDGLHVVAQYNFDTQDGRDAFSNVRKGLFPEFSFGFQVPPGGSERKDGVRYIKDLDWYEWSPVLVGANRDTGTLWTKERKAALLGDYIEPSMTMAALSRLNDALYYNVVWDAVNDDETPLPERLATLRAAFDEYRDIALRTVESLLDQDPETVSKSLRSLWIDPSITQALTEAERTDITYAKHLDAVASTVREFANRTERRREVRVKEGRVLSEATRSRLKTVHEHMQAGCDHIASLLDESEKGQAPSLVALQLFADFQRAEARFNGVPV
ncbi:MAG: HK97 family phage prohead protease [Actinomycetota bacterium]|nr:HK97 family phage prohead protease [Actinomycetota bacterium]